MTYNKSKTEQTIVREVTAATDNYKKQMCYYQQQLMQLHKFKNAGHLYNKWN